MMIVCILSSDDEKTSLSSNYVIDSDTEQFTSTLFIIKTTKIIKLKSYLMIVFCQMYTTR